MNDCNWIAILTSSRMEFPVRDEIVNLGVGETFIPELNGHKGGAHQERRLLFSRYIFLKPSTEGASVSSSVKRVNGVCELLGCPSREYRSVSDAEMNVLRSLCSGRVDPQYIALPEAGRQARIRSGAMAGAIGIVQRSDPRETVLAFSLPILAGAYELRIPTMDVIVLDESEPRRGFRRRGGRRMRRFLSKTDWKVQA